ncbi:MAG: hypothetical protein KJ941_01395 [Bacteroidetes bacterium]|nr:hypothetical protein [Bacteroidota bacterium]
MLGKRLLFVLTLCAFSCSKRHSTGIEVIGHAGFGLGTPNSIYHSNSAEAVGLAVKTDQCSGFEIDLRISYDSVLFLVHDSNLNDNTNGSGCVENTSSKELSSLRYKGFQKERICSLESISEYLMFGKKVFLDLKAFNECDSKISDPSLWDQLLTKLNLKNKEGIFLMVNNFKMLDILGNSGWKVILSSDDIPTIESAYEQYPFLCGASIRQSKIDKKQIEEWREKGKTTYLYDVRAPSEMKQTRKMNPSGIFSDDVFGAIIELK